MVLSKLSTVCKWIAATLLIIFISFNSLIGWFLYDQNNRFYDSHVNVAITTVKIVSSEIDRLIEDKQYQVNIFTEDHAMEISHLSIETDNDDLKDNLASKIHRALPESFAFTLANSKGKPLLDDFDGNIGEICITDLMLFLETKQRRIRIHPNTHLYHFDLISK